METILWLLRGGGGVGFLWSIFLVREQIDFSVITAIGFVFCEDVRFPICLVLYTHCVHFKSLDLMGAGSRALSFPLKHSVASNLISWSLSGREA